MITWVLVSIVWNLLAYLAIGALAYKSGRSDENARWLMCRGPEATPISSVRPDSVFPVLTQEERRMAWEHPVQAMVLVKRRTQCSPMRAHEVVQAERDSALPPSTQRSRR